MGFSFVNSELISVSVLVEEILIECEETIGEYSQPFQTYSRSLLTDWLPGSLPDSDWLRSLMQLKLSNPFEVSKISYFLSYGIFRAVENFD